mmetsp:Transcript_9215/g.21576  ORF Transcript_9215/g.21576 Transcript_9215/m.21576 type:complete len:586 (-) Transcript_9215:236-1993(-)
MSNGIFWPSQTFVEAYNVRRYEGKNGTAAGAATRSPALLQSQNGSWDEAAILNTDHGVHTRPGGDYSYNLIRSDLEDDQPQSLPDMPHHAFGVRQRTLQHLAFQSTAFDADQQRNGPMFWVESAWFHGLSGLVIFANAVIIGVETDIDTPVWFYIEQLLLTFFVCELAFRLMRHGCHFFRHEEDWGWNCFDFSIVMSGVFDQWLIPLVTLLGLFDHNSDGGRMAVVFMLMRLARLLRIVRLFRLVRIVRPLYELAQGVLEALQGMFWVLVFMVMTLYSAAVLCTRLLGRGDILPEEAAADDEVQHIQAMFASVDESMFTLFGTMSSWSLLKFAPLFKEMPVLRPLFVLFYVYSAWALLAVMTGVVSENMIAIREQMVKEDELREEMRKTLVTKTLMDLFREADADNSGTVSRDEFNAMLRSPDLIRKITRNTHMKVQDLQDLFEWLDHDGQGTVTVDEFMTGFRWANEPLRARSLVKLQERLVTDLKHLEASVTSVLRERVGEVQRLVAAPLRKVHAITEQMQGLDVRLGNIRCRLRESAAVTPTARELRDVEDRLSAKLAAAVLRLDTLGRTIRGPDSARSSLD